MTLFGAEFALAAENKSLQWSLVAKKWVSAEMVENHIDSFCFLDALASLVTVVSVGVQFFVSYWIKGFTRLRVTDRNRSLI